MLQVSVLGPVRASFRGCALRLKSRKSYAVLAYLALVEGEQETRERLVGLLWSESEEEKARASLRQIVHELRTLLDNAGYSGFEANRLDLKLARGSVEVDLWEMMRLAEQRQVHPVIFNVPRISESLVKDLEDVDPAFRIWLLAKRQTVHDRLLRNLEDGLKNDTTVVAERRKLAEAILSLDPTHEEACRLLMQFRAELGDVSGALRAYATLWETLGDEYDMEPSAATQALVAEIKQGHFDVAPPHPRAASLAGDEIALLERGGDAPILSIPQELIDHDRPAAPARQPHKIVLTVENFGLNGVGSDRTHLVLGFRHHLIACLTRFREWRVADGAAPVAGADSRPPSATRYSIDATAYQAGDTINLVMTLREHDSNIYVWSERFELKLDLWFETQQRIVRRTAMSLNIYISIDRLMRLAGEPDVSLEMYDRWLRGQEMLSRFHPDNWKRAASIFQNTIKDAPDFSLAYSSLAEMNNVVHIVHPGTWRDPAKTAETLTLARRAVALDPMDSRAQLCLGWSLAMAKHYDQAALHMDLACELNPYNYWTLISAALFHAFCGNYERARDLSGQSFSMSYTPNLAQWGYQVTILFLAGDYQACIDAADHAQDVIHTLPAWRAAALYQLGRRDESIREAKRFLAGIRCRWFGPAEPSDAAIGRWLLHLYPISKAAPWERLREGVMGGGIPVAGICHHGW